MCDIDWKLFLEYLRVFLSWPVVALILGVFVIKAFGSGIRGLLGRIVKGEGYGITIEAQPQAADPPKSNAPKELSDTDATEKWVRENPKLAIEEYTKAYNSFRWERALNLIYGTQIDLLVYLASQGDAGEKYTNLTKFHSEHQRRVGNTRYPFADYMTFLQSLGFILFDNANSVVKIQPYGIGFLDHIKGWYPDSWHSMRAY